MSAVRERIESADVIVWGEGSGFAQQIAVGPHRLNGDEPESIGGTGTGPSPYDFLCNPPSAVARPTAKRKN
jgi:hypothetical protein